MTEGILLFPVGWLQLCRLCAASRLQQCDSGHGGSDSRVSCARLGPARPRNPAGRPKEGKKKASMCGLSLQAAGEETQLDGGQPARNGRFAWRPVCVQRGSRHIKWYKVQQRTSKLSFLNLVRRLLVIPAERAAPVHSCMVSISTFFHLKKPIECNFPWTLVHHSTEFAAISANHTFPLDLIETQMKWRLTELLDLISQ